MRAYLLGLTVLLLVRVCVAQELLEVEQALCVSTNQLRAQTAAPPLTLDPLLSEIARGHSEEMLTHQYFSHDSPNQLCKTVRDRLRFGHRFCLTSAENLHKCQGYEYSSVARIAMQSWMESPSHRRNLVNPHFNRVGIGVARRGGIYMFTQLFSFEPIIVQQLQVQLAGSGYEIHITALVAAGPREGGWFVNGKRVGNWVADDSSLISADLHLNSAGIVEIGQLVGVRDWQVETTIPIPPPEMHLKHSQSRLLLLAGVRKACAALLSVVGVADRTQ